VLDAIRAAQPTQVTVLPAQMSFTTRPSPNPASRKRCATGTGAHSCLTRTAAPARTPFNGQNAGFSNGAPVEAFAAWLGCSKIISARAGCGERTVCGYCVAAGFGNPRYGRRVVFHQFKTQAGFLIELSHFILEYESNEKPAQENGTDGHCHCPGGGNVVAAYGCKSDSERCHGYCQKEFW